MSASAASSPVRPRSLRRPRVGAAWFTVAVTAALSAGASAAPASPLAEYSLVIDAGSSGSRMRIYRTLPPERQAAEAASMESRGLTNDAFLDDIAARSVEAVSPRPGDESLFHTEPGLSSYASHPEGAGPSLAGLIEAAKANIPYDDHPRTRLWLKATAGMRALPQVKLDAIFKSANEYLSDTWNSPFQLMSTAVLGGEEEAVYGFLGINEMLAQEEARSKGMLDEEGGEVGVLDMGGASIQVAYKPEASILDGEFHFYMNRERQSVYARSFPQFGLDTALDRALASLATKATSASANASSLDFPCFHQGYSEHMDIGGRTWRISGTGRSAECHALTEGLLHKEYECLLSPCPFMGVHMPKLTGKERFYAMANFFYVPNGLGLLGWDERKALQPSELLAATEGFCGRSYSDLAGESSRQHLKYRRKFCFGGHYIWHVLRSLGFEADSKNMISVRRLDGEEADWTLGFVLYETQEMPLRRFGPAGPAQTAPKLPSGVAAPRLIGAPVAPARPLPEPAAPQDSTEPARGPAAGGGAPASPCKPPVSSAASMGDEAKGMFELANAPSVLGIPGWYLYVMALAAASMFGWFAHQLPMNYVCCCGGGAFSLEEGLPMSPVALFRRGEAAPSLFRAASAPSIQHYLQMGGPGSPMRSGSPTKGAQSPQVGCGGGVGGTGFGGLLGSSTPKGSRSPLRPKREAFATGPSFM